MKTFFSLLSIESNPYSNEELVVGLIAISDKIYFDYSVSKLNWIKKLENGKQLYFLSDLSLKKLNSLVESENKKNIQGKLLDNIFSFNYFQYLSQYSAGALKFSEPFQLSVEINQQNFAIYFEKFIGEKLLVKKMSVATFYSKIYKLIEKNEIANKVDINYHLNPNKFSELVKETKLTLITKNGAVSALNSIDFNASPNTIVSKLYESQIVYESLYKFSNQHGLKLKKMKLAIEEPEANTEQKQLFDNVSKFKKDYFDCIHVDEIDNFTNEIANSSYSKFSLFVEG